MDASSDPQCDQPLRRSGPLTQALAHRLTGIGEQVRRSEQVRRCQPHQGFGPAGATSTPITRPEAEQLEQGQSYQHT